jgi:formate hydrogenlyase transcriptional activator
MDHPAATGNEAAAVERTTADRARVLLEINNAIVSHLDLVKVLRAISTCLRREIKHDLAGMALYDEERHELRLHALDFPADQQFMKQGQLIPLVGTPASLAFSTRKPVLRHRPDFEEFPAEMMKAAYARGIRSGCAVPLICHDKIVGSMVVASLRESAFTEHDVELLTQIGDQAAIAIVNAQNFERARAAQAAVTKERDRTQLLLDVNNAVVSHLDPGDLLKSISASLRRIVQHDAAFVTILDPSGENLRLYALNLRTPNSASFDESILIPVGGTPEGEAIFSRGIVLVRNQGDIQRFSPFTVAESSKLGIKSGCAVPLIAHGRPLGALSMVSFQENSFTEEDARLLAQCANQIAIAVENALTYREIEALKDRLAQEKLYLEDEIRNEFNFEEIIGQSPALRKVLQLVDTVAASDSTVLLLGETGTGKELIARAVHEHSRRKTRTFVKLNCAAIPTGLLESELFGHEKGAFTGAISQKVGRLELADQGTLFLDEVGDIPIEIQPKLLRALQEREFERLGSTYTKKVNVRLVAATNRDLEKMIQAREFRSDLYYRLNVFPIRIPPLRERPEDIPLLVRYFAQKFARQMQKSIESIPAATMSKLQAWHWPGNVRELENLVERSVILSTGPALQVSLGENQPSPPQTALANVTSSSSSRLDDTEREHIIKVLRETRGILAGPNGAASRLGLKRTTLQYKLKKLGITRDHWWPASAS